MRLFAILQLLSTDFIYIGKIIDTVRKNAITSERAAADETKGAGERGGEIYRVETAARFNPRNSRCVADIGGTCYVRDNRYKG